MSGCLCLDCKKDANSLSESAKIRAKKRRTELTELIGKNLLKLGRQVSPLETHV